MADSNTNPSQSSSSSSTGTGDEDNSNEKQMLSDGSEYDAKSICSSSATRASDVRMLETLKMNPYASEIKKFTPKYFQTYLMNITNVEGRQPFSPAEAMALVRALIAFIGNCKSDDIVDLFRESTKCKDNTIGKKTWTTVITESNYYEWLKKSTTLRIAVAESNHARNYYNWTSLDKGSRCPQFCDFLSMFVYVMFSAKGKFNPANKSKGKKIQGIANEAMIKKFGAIVSFEAVLDFTVLGIDQEVQKQFKNAKSHNMINTAFHVPGLKEASLGIPSNEYGVVEALYKLFNEHKAAGRALIEQSEIFNAISEEMSTQFVEVMDSYEHYAALHVLFMRAAEKQLEATPSVTSDKELLNQVICRFQKNTVFQDDLFKAVLSVVPSSIETTTATTETPSPLLFGEISVTDGLNQVNRGSTETCADADDNQYTDNATGDLDTQVSDRRQNIQKGPGSGGPFIGFPEDWFARFKDPHHTTEEAPGGNDTENASEQ